jgi:hypothetical protein
VALGWAASGLRWPASAGAVLGYDGPPGELLSLYIFFSFHFLFLFSVF